MKQRVEVGSDIATIGIWDESHGGGDSLAGVASADFERGLVAAAEDGRAFFLRLGGDWSGAVDVSVDEAVPDDVLERMRGVGDRLLLAVPSGRAVVGGAEDFRGGDPQVTSEDSAVAVPAGEYSLRCFELTEGESLDDVDLGLSREEIEAAIGTEDYDYHQRVSRRVVGGCWLTLLLPLLVYLYGGWTGVGSTVVLILGYLFVVDWIARRDRRYQRIQTAIGELFAAARARALPVFLFALDSVAGDHGLRGGVIDLDEVGDG